MKQWLVSVWDPWRGTRRGVVTEPTYDAAVMRVWHLPPSFIWSVEPYLNHAPERIGTNINTEA